MIEYGTAAKFIGCWVSNGSSSKNSFPQLSGNAARLYEKHEVISKQENPDSLPSWTSSEPILVIFK